MEIDDFVIPVHPANAKYYGVGIVIQHAAWSPNYRYVLHLKIKDSHDTGIREWHVTAIRRVCRNCKQPEDCHGKRKKCLFGATTWS